jgi:hypothetical protein
MGREKWLYNNIEDEGDPNFRKVELYKKHILDGIEERQTREEEVLRMNPYERRMREDSLAGGKVWASWVL